MSKIPKVAVITRTRDRLMLLERTIKSVQSQSMKDFVQVIINDGGNQNDIEALLDTYEKKYPGRIKLIHNPKNRRGRTSALNQAIKESDSEFVAVLDDDDTWHRDFLKKTTEHLNKTGSKGVITVMDRVVEELKGRNIRKISQDRWRPDVREVSLYGQCIDNHATPCCFIYRRSVYEELGGYNEELNVVEDWDFALRFLLKYDIDFLETEEALAYYHHRPASSGIMANTVFAGVDEHRSYLNMLSNRYLREDIRAGKFGLGYIMNSLRYQRSAAGRQDELEERRTVRIEKHVERQVEAALDRTLDFISLRRRVKRLYNRLLKAARRAK